MRALAGTLRGNPAKFHLWSPDIENELNYLMIYHDEWYQPDPHKNAENILCISMPPRALGPAELLSKGLARWWRAPWIDDEE
jgi:hypothetical protein